MIKRANLALQNTKPQLLKLKFIFNGKNTKHQLTKFRSAAKLECKLLKYKAFKKICSILDKIHNIILSRIINVIFYTH